VRRHQINAPVDRLDAMFETSWKRGAPWTLALDYNPVVRGAVP